MTKRPYNFGHTYELRQLRLQRRADYKITKYYRRRLNQLIKKRLTVNSIKSTLEQAGIY